VTWHSISAQLRQVPWAALVQQAQTVLVALLVWILTKRHYDHEWEKWAPEKARDVIAQLRRQLCEEQAHSRGLKAKLAKREGQLATVRRAATEPVQLELVERREARR